MNKKRYLILLADRKHAKLFMLYDGEVGHQKEFSDDLDHKFPMIIPLVMYFVKQLRYIYGG